MYVFECGLVFSKSFLTVYFIAPRLAKLVIFAHELILKIHWLGIKYCKSKFQILIQQRVTFLLLLASATASFIIIAHY